MKTAGIINKPWWADADKVALIHRTVAVGATEDEMAFFTEHCKRTGLDPFGRQIYMVERTDRKYNAENREWENIIRRETQATIDGFRAVAADVRDENGKREYEGQPPAMWCGEDGEWHDVWVKDTPPVAARVGVYRAGFREALYAVARWDSYAVMVEKILPGGEVIDVPNEAWESMPDIMLAKCAEALAFRKAFPQSLSGIYTAEEMENVEGRTSGKAAARAPRTAAKKASKIEEREDERDRKAREVSAKQSKIKAEGELPILGAGKWREATVHFGKQGVLLGKKLGDMGKSQIEYIRDMLTEKKKRSAMDEELLAHTLEALGMPASAPQLDPAPEDPRDQIPMGDEPMPPAEEGPKKTGLRVLLEELKVNCEKFMHIAGKEQWTVGTVWSEITEEEADVIVENWEGTVDILKDEGAIL